METLREILTKKALSNGYKPDEICEYDLEETLRKWYTEVHRRELRKHRWRIEHWVVAEIEGRFFQFTDFTSLAGDDNPESCGYEFEGIDNVLEVFPHKESITTYKLTPYEGGAS